MSDKAGGYVVRPAAMPVELVHQELLNRLTEAADEKFGKGRWTVRDVEIRRAEFYTPEHEADMIRRLSTTEDGTFLDPGPGAEVWRIRALYMEVEG